MIKLFPHKKDASDDFIFTLSNKRIKIIGLQIYLGSLGNIMFIIYKNFGIWMGKMRNIFQEHEDAYQMFFSNSSRIKNLGFNPGLVNQPSEPTNCSLV